MTHITGKVYPVTAEAITGLVAELEQVKAENAKLLEALEHIAGREKSECCNNACDGDYLDSHFIELAREALKECGHE